MICWNNGTLSDMRIHTMWRIFSLNGIKRAGSFPLADVVSRVLCACKTAPIIMYHKPPRRLRSKRFAPSGQYDRPLTIKDNGSIHLLDCKCLTWYRLHPQPKKMYDSTMSTEPASHFNNSTNGDRPDTADSRGHALSALPLLHTTSDNPTAVPPSYMTRMFYRSEQLRPWTSFADAPFLLSIAAFKMSKPTIIWIWSWLYYSEIQDKGAGWRLFAFVFCCRDKALSSTDEELKAGSAYYSCA